MKHVLVAITLAVAACSSATTTHHDGGAGNDMSIIGAGRDMSSGDMALACNMPGPCDNNTGVCCWRQLGPTQSVFCDTVARCPLEHGVDTAESPLCATAADCYKAERRDLGALFCCPDSVYPISICRFTPCPGTP